MPEQSRSTPLAVVILAAGKGTRMKNPDKAKVMYEIDGKPMVEYVVELAGTLQANRTLLIVGWKKETVIDHISARHPHVEFVHQDQQLGTGHAVLQAESLLDGFAGDVLVLSGDVPLLTEKTVKALLGYHQMSQATATILTAELDDPTGYGRIVRGEGDNVERIVEQKDASRKELAITEINSGIYVFEKEKLIRGLHKITPENAQREYYLTDVFGEFWKSGWKVSAVKAIDSVEVMGINDLAQLEQARRLLQERKAGTSG